MDTRGDQYGNRVGQTDAYGKPAHGTTADDFSSNPLQQQTAGQDGAQAQMMRHTAEPAVAQPEGMAEKIKENLPGGHGEPQTHGATTGGGYGSGANTTATGTTQVPAAGQHEKRGMGEKIKENLPGGHGQPQTHGTAATGATHVPAAGQHEKKGMGEKIKENLPGGHGQAQTHGTTGHGGAGTTGTTGGGFGGDNTTATGTTAAGQPEKKGMVEKIKEKLPGGKR